MSKRGKESIAKTADLNSPKGDTLANDMLSMTQKEGKGKEKRASSCYESIFPPEQLLWDSQSNSQVATMQHLLIESRE